MEVSKSTKKPLRIKVIGVGTAGGYIVARIIESGLQGVEFIAVNNDRIALEQSKALDQLLIGEHMRGLDMFTWPEHGQKAAMDARDRIEPVLADADLIFVTAGMGGVIGSGGAPVIAGIAKEKGIPSVALVSLPFVFEGRIRSRCSREAMREMIDSANAAIILCTDHILYIEESMQEKMTLVEALHLADTALYLAFQCFSAFVTEEAQERNEPDLTSIINEKGIAYLSFGAGIGENRAVAAARMAVHTMKTEQPPYSAPFAYVSMASGARIDDHEAKQAVKSVAEALSPNTRVHQCVDLMHTQDAAMYVAVITFGHWDVF